MFVARNGEIDVRLNDSLRGLLQRVGEELREVLLVNDPDLTKRLYPTAYPSDEELESNYQDMVHDQLLMQRLDALDSFQATVEDDSIAIEAADDWMTTINQMRLVLGTQLDVGENDADIDEDDPSAQSKVIYQVLSHILEDLTAARIKSL